MEIQGGGAPSYPSCKFKADLISSHLLFLLVQALMLRYVEQEIQNSQFEEAE